MQGVLSPNFLSGLTRDAGTEARQFVASGGFTPALEQQVDRKSADIIESQGPRGTRFGTSSIREQGRILEGASTAASANQLQGIQTMGQIDANVLNQFLQLAGMGIGPEQTFVQENPLLSIFKGIVSGGAAAASGGLG